MKKTILKIIQLVKDGKLNNLKGFRARNVFVESLGFIPISTARTFLAKHPEYFERIDRGLYRVRKSFIEEI